jgi:transcriptional regulator with XRE-family HTH domain
MAWAGGTDGECFGTRAADRASVARRGLSQAALAGLAGRSESWLSQVERGLRQVDSHSVLVSLAEILRVDIGELTGDEPGDPRASRYAAAREIERAMMAYDALESVIAADFDVHAPDLAQLRLDVERVNRSYRAPRYEEAGRILPGRVSSATVAQAASACWLYRDLRDGPSAAHWYDRAMEWAQAAARSTSIRTLTGVTAFSAPKARRLLYPACRLIGAERERFTIVLCALDHGRITSAAQGPRDPVGAHVRTRLGM